MNESENILRKKKTLLEKYEIPIEHLDYKYINDCTNVKYLEKILRILKSGEEGIYPQLQKHCEEKLKKLFPKSKVLRECVPILKQQELSKEERENIKSSLENWENEIKFEEKNVKVNTPPKELFTLPSIRNTKGKKSPKLKTRPLASANKNKIKSHEYDKWDKLDVEKELQNMDDETNQPENQGHTDFSDPEIDIKHLSDKEKKMFAEKEKVKGNEAYQSGQFSEAIFYYSRSINILPNSAAYNNRAQTYIKIKEFEKAIHDCEEVIKLEPKNAKAFFRRGTAFQELEQLIASETDFEKVLQLEPLNKQAQAHLKEVREKLNKDKPKKKGTKINIVEATNKNSASKISKSFEIKEEDKNLPETSTSFKTILIEEVDHDDEMEELFKEKSDATSLNIKEEMPVLDSSKQKLIEPQHLKKALMEPEEPLNCLSEDFNKTLPVINNPYEFYRVWHTEKVGMVPQLASQVLQNIPAQKLPEFLSNKLDGHMMTQILAALRILILREPKQTLALLKSLCNVQRIAIILLFLTNSEKELIRVLLDELSPHASLDEVHTLQKTLLS